MNETDNLENENANEQAVSSNEVSEITEDSKEQTEQTEQPKEAETEQDSYTITNTETLVEQVSQINQKLDTVSNVLIVSMVGIAILVGITACNIFSRYFKS